MSLFELSILYLCAHFIGDFAFQSAWMAAEKGKKFEVLIYHCATYTAPFAVLLALLNGRTPFAPDALFALAIFGTHIVIDTLSARLKVIKTIWADQLCHFAVIALLLFVGWL
ncbi:DUF3307 domain-containing protein [Candidatus Uhrbacteria bacterium]|nr:DUF3307 domain-containing protein [Candidatus Uhrbacteria bacterium]